MITELFLKTSKKMYPEKFLGTKSAPQKFIFFNVDVTAKRCSTNLVSFKKSTGLHGTSCTKDACRFSRYATLNSLVK